MGDELRQHAPTLRRLEKLRQAGVTPSSSALGAVAVLAAATAIAGLAWRPACGALQGMILRGLQANLRAEQLPRVLADHLLTAGLVIGLLALVLALVAAVVQVAAGGARLHTPWRGGVQRWRGPRADWPGVVLGLGALVGTAVIGLPCVLRWAQARKWSELAAGPDWIALWLRELALLAGLALLHLLWTRAEYLQQARLTHRELRDEQRETEGSGLTKQFARRGHRRN